MKLYAATILVVLCTVQSFAQQVGFPGANVPDSTDQTFEHVARLWFTAYNGTDARALEPLYTEDAQYISAHVPGLVAMGREAIIANFARGMKLGGHLEGIEILSVRRSCDLATVLCQYYANNAGERVSGRTLLVLRKTEEGWRIVLHMTVV